MIRTLTYTIGHRERPSRAQRFVRTTLGCICGCPLLIFAIISVRVKCSPEDTVGDLKKLIAAQTGTDARKIQLKKWCAPELSLRVVSLTGVCVRRYTIYKDHITLADYEIHDGMSLEMY